MKKLTMKKSNLTFEEGCEKYLNYCHARNLREGTIKHYKESMTSIYRFIDPKTPLSSIDTATIDDFILAMKTTLIIKDTTLYTYSRDLKTILRYFMKQGYIKQFSINLIHADKEPIECYSDSELNILLKKPNMKTCSFSEYKSWVIINFLLSTGIRMNSLINIQIKDIDFDNDVIYIRTTKNRKSLIIPLNRTIIRILKEYLPIRQYNSENDYLFCNVFGKQLVKSTLYHSLRQYHFNRKINKTGIHRYRHTFAKKWILKGGNVVTLQKILGHSSLQMTQNYISMLTTDLENEVNKINIINDFYNTHISLK